MANVAVHVPRVGATREDSVGSVRIGKLVSIDDAGRPYVTFNGCCEPTRARVGTSAPRPSESALSDGVPVLLTFEDENPSRPIIVGFVKEAFSVATATD